MGTYNSGYFQTILVMLNGFDSLKKGFIKTLIWESGCTHPCILKKYKFKSFLSAQFVPFIFDSLKQPAIQELDYIVSV